MNGQVSSGVCLQHLLEEAVMCLGTVHSFFLIQKSVSFRQEISKVSCPINMMHPVDPATTWKRCLFLLTPQESVVV